MQTICAACIILWLLCSDVHGSTYAVVLVGLDVSNDTSTLTSRYDLMVINKETVTIVVAVKNASTSIDNLTLGPMDETTFTLDATYGLNGSEYTNKTILVSSVGNFTLQVFSLSDHHAEGFIGIPMEDLLGPHAIQDVYEYVAVTFCATSGFCQLAVSAFQDAMVKLTFPPNVTDIVFCIGRRYFRNIRDYFLNMTQYDAVQVESTRDLTGTHIYSYSPIAVYVGARNLSTTGGFLAHMFEQLPTASQWGTEFLVKTVGQAPSGDIIKIMSSNWTKTRVEMTRFGPVIMPGLNVITRRLKKDAYCHIKSDNPVQVVQIIGMTSNASDPVTGSTTKVALTMVPAREHVINSTRVTCGPGKVFGEFIVFAERYSSIPTLNNIAMTLTDDVMYTKYGIYGKTGRNLPLYTLGGNSLSGVVQCQNGPTFPIGLTHTVNSSVDNGQQNENVGTCIEGESVEYRYDTDGMSSYLADRSFEGFSILRFRVRVCGEAFLKLQMDTGYIVIRLSGDRNYISVCEDDTCDETIDVYDTFNEVGNCNTDMKWYWLKQEVIHHGNSLSFGTGLGIPEQDGTLSPDFIRLMYSKVERFTFFGHFADASINYDLEPDTGCTTIITEWSCEDKVKNCSLYGKGICNNANNTSFSTDVCPKYCGHCKTDIFGRKFVVVLPKDESIVSFFPGTICTVQINAMEAVANIAVASIRTILTQHKVTNNSVTYNCFKLMDSGIFWIRSDVDISVSVVMVFRYNRGSVTFNVAPVDTFAMEYVALINNDTFACHLVTEGTQAEVNAYFKGSLVDITNDTILAEGAADFQVNPDKATTANFVLENQHSGVLFRSNKPIGVFCGNYEDRVPYFNQLVPVNVLGNHYRTPRFGRSTSNIPDVLRLTVQALEYDTSVTLIGHAKNTCMLELPGDGLEYTLDPEKSYELNASHVVSAGLQINIGSSQAFILLPPVLSFSPEYDLTTHRLHESVVDAYVITTAGDSFHVKYDTTSNIDTFDVTISDDDATMTDDVDGSVFGIFVTRIRSIPFAIGGWGIIPTASIHQQLNESEVCELTKATAHDGIDNDCDGSIDEDTCCREDRDMDGSFTDDFKDVIEEEYIPASEPACIPIDKPKHQCWAVCQCPCTWVENLLASSQLSRDEFTKLQRIKAVSIQKNLTINKKDLVKVTSRKMSATDRRQSAANVGYVGIALFMIAVSFIIFLDISAIKRDFKILARNLRIRLCCPSRE